jgi:HD-GYP domain-containing protein (c-di-GMP phosphodiesterase class II)
MTNHKIIKQIEKLIEIGIALSSEEKVDILLEKILLGAKSITEADGGTLYRVQDNSLKIAIIHSDSLKIHLGGSSGIPVKMDNIQLYHENGTANLRNVACYAYHNKVAVNVLDAYDKNAQFDFSGPKEFDRRHNYRTKSLLAIPMKNHKGDIIGVLQLINALDPTSGVIIGFDNVSQEITEALASQAAIVLTQQHLIADLEKMFECLVKLIATTIDQKSPYTGAHCRRVPELTMMLAEAVHDTQEGYFKDFTLSDADRYELKIAAWLHDCGKITTPEYVIDKATKLQTIYDRIELIETRGEILKRDREIELLKQKIAALENHQAPDAAAEQQLNRAVAQIEDDLSFIKRINLGGEFMRTEDLQRLRAISAAKWRMNGKTLPFLSENETRNLSIVKGTLTGEERQVINNHIVATIAMLESITFPKHLKNVPEFAGGHHERMDGKGYPRGLTREQMSVQARIMGIADVFEALMAKDRPYKPGKKLSEALAILKNMKENGHIDPDLYDVFINKKVYRRFAEQFIDPEQIDVD